MDLAPDFSATRIPARPESHTLRYSLMILAFVLLTSSLKAALIQSAAAGDWSAPATWVGGVVPAATDDVEVLAGHTVTITDNRTCNNLTVSGTLEKTVYPALITINGPLLINNGGFFNSVNQLVVFNAAVSVNGRFFMEEGSNATFNLTNFVVGLSGWFKVTKMTVNVGAGCSILGRFEARGANSNLLNINAGSTCSAKNLFVYGVICNDNIGIAPDTLTLGGFLVSGTTYIGRLNSNFNLTIPTLQTGNSTINGTGIVTVSSKLDLAGTLDIQNLAELKIEGANNNILGTLKLFHATKVTFASGTTTVIGNGFSVGYILLNSVTATANLDIKAGATITNTNALDYAFIRPKFVSSGNISGKLDFGGYGGRTYTFNGGTLSGESLFNSSTNGVDSFLLNNVNINSTWFRIGPFFSGSGLQVVKLEANCSVNNAVVFSLYSGKFVDNIGLTHINQFYFASGTYLGNSNPIFSGGISYGTGCIFAGSGIANITGPVASLSATPQNIGVSGTKEVRIAASANVVGFTVGTGAKLTFMSGSTVNSYGGVTGTGLFEQQNGSIWNISGFFPGEAHNIKSLIQGTLNVNANNFEFDPTSGVSTFSGAAVNIPTNKVFSIIGNSLSSLTITNTSISGAGTFQIGNSGGAVPTINANTGTTLTTKLTLYSGGTFNDNVGLSPGEVFMNNSFAVYGGTGSPTFANGFIWNSGRFRGSGTVSITGTINIGIGNIENSKIIAINGTANKSFGTLTMTGTAKIFVQNGSVFNLNAGDIVGASSGTQVVVKSGGILNKNTTSISGCPISIEAGGVVNVNAGTLKFSNPGSLYTIIYNGTINVSAGAIAEIMAHNCSYKGSFFNNSGTVLLGLDFFGTGFNLEFSGTSGQTLGGSGGVLTRMNLNNPNHLTISGIQRINTTLTLTSGKILLENGDLTVGSIAGASASNYLATTGTGRLRMNVGTTGLLFPAGPDLSSYNPVTLSLGSGADTFAVRVKTGFDYPTGGPDYVNRQWTIDRPSGNTTAATAVFQWVTPGHIAGSFTPGSCHVSRWTGVEWQSYGDAAASCVSNTCTRTQTNITNFSPFGVASGTALPVELVAFRAVRQQDLVALQWSTETERRNRGFNVQRATDGLQFEDIGFVTGKGDSDQRSDYSFDDITAPASKRLYYRLRQEDTDGNTTYSPIVTVAGQGIAGAILSPNPVRDKATLQLVLDAETELSLAVCDMQGRLVHALPPVFVPAGEQLIDLPALNLPSGSYFLRISSVSGIQWLRFIIHH